MSGFFSLHRDAFLHPLLKDADRFRAWFWLVAHAAWKPTEHDARGHTIKVERGQLCAGREHLAKEWGWSPSAVERFLRRLETEQMIERQTGQMKTVITICNYDVYQDARPKPEHMSGHKTGQKPDRNRTAKEEGNKETRDELAKASPSSARRATAWVRPDWADPAIWSDFLENRKAKRLRNTATAYAGFLADIAKLTSDEWPPGRLLEHAAQRGWGAIYLPREDHHGPVSRTPAIAPSGRTMGRTEAAARAVVARLAGNDGADRGRIIRLPDPVRTDRDDSGGPRGMAIGGGP